MCFGTCFQVRTHFENMFIQNTFENMFSLFILIDISHQKQGPHFENMLVPNFGNGLCNDYSTQDQAIVLVKYL